MASKKKAPAKKKTTTAKAAPAPAPVVGSLQSALESELKRLGDEAEDMAHSAEAISALALLKGGYKLRPKQLTSAQKFLAVAAKH